MNHYLKTYQDLLAAGDSEESRMQFIAQAIDAHRGSPAVRTARDAEQYYKKLNPTIRKYERILYTLSGDAVPDPFRANHRIASGFFNRFVDQQTQFLLGAGVTLTEDANKDKLGDDFDDKLLELGHEALLGGVAFGFWNGEHLSVFSLTEFVPLYDENNGALMAGIRYWQVNPDKPLRATLYELDGYTDYLRREDAGRMEVLVPKRHYIEHHATSEAFGDEIYDRENFPGFPVIPLWANKAKQSELVGIREAIDCYDLIKSGFANDLDQASMIYWILENTGGMDDIDLAQFLDRMHTVGAAVVNTDEGAGVEAHTMEVPYESRTAYLDRLEEDLYKDFQALDVSTLAGGDKTATEIEAAYEPMNSKADGFEHCVRDFLRDLFDLIGIDDKPAFKRHMICNQLETTQMVILAAAQIGDDMVLRKLPWLTADEVSQIIEDREADDFDRLSGGTDGGPSDPDDVATV